jgi:hypothetical protein
MSKTIWQENQNKMEYMFSAGSNGRWRVLMVVVEGKDNATSQLPAWQQPTKAILTVWHRV